MKTFYNITLNYVLRCEQNAPYYFTGMDRWVEPLSCNQTVTGSIPSPIDHVEESLIKTLNP